MRSSLWGLITLVVVVIPTRTAAASSSSVADVADYLLPISSVPNAAYAPWAHDHWVWLGASEANGTLNYELVQAYLAHNISVGAVNFDSTWESGWTNFQPSSLYPDIAQTIAQVHALNVKVICWATSMIDTDSSNFQYAQTNNYFILNGLNSTGIMKWWHGYGALLDYTNPAAVEWWHQQMSTILAAGIDGFKVDGTDPFIMELISPHTSSGQPIQYREYADAVYGDFFDYAREQIGPEALTMSRPVDSVSGVYLAYSPLRVMTSGWTGDQTPDFPGLIDCAKKVLQSSWRNYANFACDTGGYKSGQRTRELMIRWSAFMAFLPLFENGGDNDHTPWAYDQGQENTTMTTDMYRLFVNAHTSLGPYLLTTGSNALDTQTSSITPLAANGSTSITVTGFNPSTFDYYLGESIFVSPILTANTTSQFLTLPSFEADNVTSVSYWVNFFQPLQIIPGGSNLWINVSLDDSLPYPVFQPTGGILPLHVTSDSMPHHGLGSAWREAVQTKVSEEELELGVNAKLPTPPLTLYIPLSMQALEELTATGRHVHRVIRRFQATSIEVQYYVDRDASSTCLEAASASSTCYRLHLTASPTVDNAPIIVVLGAVPDYDEEAAAAAAGAEGVSADSHDVVDWNPETLQLRVQDQSLSSGISWYEPREHATQADLHRTMVGTAAEPTDNGLLSSYVLDCDRTHGLMIQTGQSLYGLKVDIHGLSITSSLPKKKLIEWMAEQDILD